MKESIKNEKKKQKKHREIYLVLLLLLGISVGFSYLTSQLDIIGNTRGFLPVSSFIKALISLVRLSFISV